MANADPGGYSFGETGRVEAKATTRPGCFPERCSIRGPFA
jgi:hypothetical protein